MIFNTRNDTVTGLFTLRSELSATGATIAVGASLAPDSAPTRGPFAERHHWPLSAALASDRSEIYIKTNMLGRFPRRTPGDHGVARPRVPLGDDVSSATRLSSPCRRRAPSPQPYRTISPRRDPDHDGHHLWQFRNFLGERYTQVPGLLMPRQTNFYGVRWSFTD